MRFASVNDYGNNIFLDNIALAEYALPQPVATIAASADTLCRLDTILLSASPVGSNTTYNWTFGASAQPATAAGNGPVLAARYLTGGNKSVRLIVSNALGADTAFYTVPVLGLASANFTWATDSATVTFANTSTNAQAYLWDFGDGNTSTEFNPVHTYSAPGNYTVTLTATNSCSTMSSTRTQSVNLTFVGTDSPDGNMARVLPNPTSGDFSVELSTTSAAPLQIRLYDARGRLIKTVQTEPQEGRVVVPFEGLDLPAGMYQVHIQTSMGLRTLSVSVQ